MMFVLRRIALAAVALLIASAVWLPVLHLFYTEDATPYLASRGVPPRVQRLAAYHMHLWQDDTLRATQQQRMRGSNAEWDFMGRTFLVLAMANLAERDPAQRDDYVAVMRQVIDDTLAVEQARGHTHFLMPYAKARPFVQRPARSVFVDGEIALMLGALRCVVGDSSAARPDDATRFTARIELLARRLQQAPNHCGESYPDECWMFCNAAAMVALRMADVLDGTDHNQLIDAWLNAIRTRLTHRESGLLVSSFDRAGRTRDGPEGSSIWFVAHCLDALDAEFALDQYRRARTELARGVAGFGYAAEWPRSLVGPPDIDSGAVIPLLDISAGASGMAFIAAAGFGDAEYLAALLATLDFAAMPVAQDGRLHYAASNQVGDAVLLYALAQGPLWDRIRRRSEP